MILKIFFLLAFYVPSLSFDDNKYTFKDYCCISERALDQKLWRSWGVESKNSSSPKKEKCLEACSEYAFVLYNAKHHASGETTEMEEEREKSPNCFCFRIRSETGSFAISPTQMTKALYKANHKDEPGSYSVECARSQDYSLSCKVGSLQNWCSVLDAGLKYEYEYSHRFSYDKNFFPKCVHKNNLNLTAMLTAIPCHEGNQTDEYITRSLGRCAAYNLIFLAKHKVADQERCFCANETLFNKQLLHVHDKCERSSSNHHGNELATSGTNDNYFSIYCADNEKCQAVTANWNKFRSKSVNQYQHRFSYFGCMNRGAFSDGGILYNFSKNNAQGCFDGCFRQQPRYALDSSPLGYQNITLFIRPRKDGTVDCICNSPPKSIPTIETISYGCDLNWCPGVAGPCGNRAGDSGDYEYDDANEDYDEEDDGEGYSMYCQNSLDENDVCVEVLANPDNFFAMSPGRIEGNYTIVETTTTTTQTTATTVKSTSLHTTSTSTAATSVSSTTNRASSSTQTTLSTTAKSSTLTSTATESTKPEVSTISSTTPNSSNTTRPTPECEKCEATTDKRGFHWEAICAGDLHNKSDACPENTTGYAVWYCQERGLQFRPKQPDRSNCVAEWLEHVEDMSMSNTSYAKNITEEILKHTSNEDANITSGTLIRLIEIGLRLTKGPIWDLDPVSTALESRVNHSLSIAKDFVQISSDLFSQCLAWDETPTERNENELIEETHDFFALQLLEANEKVGYFHLERLASDSNFTNFSYEQQTITDSRQTIEYFLSAMTEGEVGNLLPPWIGFDGDTWPTELPPTDWAVWRSFGASYDIGQLLENRTRFYYDEFEGKHGEYEILSKPGILSFSINNIAINFTQNWVNIKFKHEKQMQQNIPRLCVFWDYEHKEFSSHGCKMVKTSSMETTCSCSHLTNFGLMFDISNSLSNWDPTQMAILSWISIVMCSLSVVCALATFLILQFSRLPTSPRVSIVKNRAITLSILYLTFLLGFDPEQLGLGFALCSLVAFLLHYSALSTFSWTLLEGRQLLKSLQSNQLTDVDTVSYAMLLRYIFGYGMPLCFVTATLVGTIMLNNGEYPYNKDDGTLFCWLREKAFIYSFVVPVTCIILFNMYVFCRAVRVSNEARKSLRQSKKEKIYSQMKSWVILSFLLGITWSMGFLIQEGMQEMAYVFVFFNASSGIFIFIHTILSNEVILQELRIRLGFEKKENMAINNSGSRLNAVKSFKRDEKPKIKKRHKSSRIEDPDRFNSTSSDEVVGNITARNKTSNVTFRQEYTGSSSSLSTGTTSVSSTSSTDRQDIRDPIYKTAIMNNMHQKKKNVPFSPEKGRLEYRRSNQW